MKINLLCLDGETRARDVQFTKPGPFSTTHPALGKMFYFAGRVLIRTDMRLAPAKNVYGLTGSRLGRHQTFYPDNRAEYLEEE